MWGTGEGTDDQYPSGYINYLLFDENHNFVSRVLGQIKGRYEDGRGGGTDGVPHDYF